MMEETVTSRLGHTLSCWRDALREIFVASGWQALRKSHDDGNGAGDSLSLLLWRKEKRLEKIREAARDMVMGYAYFSIGSPHQELVPWCGWLRNVQARHLDWLIAWPEEDHLHP